MRQVNHSWLLFTFRLASEPTICVASLKTNIFDLHDRSVIIP
jgi:hypothetical protein